MIEEEIIYSKGKQRIKQKIIKLRDYDIQQPDYAQGGILVYHIDRITKLHEDDQRYTVIQKPSTTDATAAADPVAQGQAKTDEQDKSAAEEKVQPVEQKPELVISAPLITQDQLFDFQITNIKIFPKSERLL